MRSLHRVVGSLCSILALAACSAPVEDDAGEAAGAATVGAPSTAETFEAAAESPAVGLRMALQFEERGGGRAIALTLTRGSTTKTLRCGRAMLSLDGAWQEGNYSAFAQTDWSIGCEVPGADACFVSFSLAEYEPERLADVGQLSASCVNPKGLSPAAKALVDHIAGAPVTPRIARASLPDEESADVGVRMRVVRLGTHPDEGVSPFFVHVSAAARTLLGRLPTTQQGRQVVNADVIRHAKLSLDDMNASTSLYVNWSNRGTDTEKEAAARSIRLLAGGKVRDRNELAASFLAAFGVRDGQR